MIYSRNPIIDNYDGGGNKSHEEEDSAIIVIYASTFGFILGAIILFLVLCWLCCLFQVKRRKTSAAAATADVFVVEFGVDDKTSSLSSSALKKTNKRLSHNYFRSVAYHIRFYIGCLVRYRKCAPLVVVPTASTRNRARGGCIRNFKPCWLAVCCCWCQELKSDEDFLDDYWSSAAASRRAASAIHQGDQSPNEPNYPSFTSPRWNPNAKKGSILSPDAIILPVTGSRHLPEVPRELAGRHVTYVDFYSCRLNGYREEANMMF